MSKRYCTVSIKMWCDYTFAHKFFAALFARSNLASAASVSSAYDIALDKKCFLFFFLIVP